MSARAKAAARELLDRYFIKEPSDLDIREIANAENLMIVEEYTKGHTGRICKTEEGGIITIDRKIKEEGRKNFTIGHEMGHFCLEKTNENYCKKTDLLDFYKQKKTETEANIFASELLMPEEWVKERLKWKGTPLETIEEGAKIFRTTMSSMSLRYAECGKFPIAVIFSQDKKVKWSKISEIFPYQWIESGQKVNKFSNVFEIFEGAATDNEAKEILADAWFLRDRNYKSGEYLYEQNVVMKNYNAVLTFVWEVK